MTAVTLRPSREDEGRALTRLAQRDSAPPLEGSIVVAERGGRILAALSLADRRAIADPFQPTAELVELLRVRADQLGRRPRGRGLVARPRLARRHRAALAPRVT